MRFWEMSAEEETLVGYMPDEKLSMEMTICGANPVAVRNVLRGANATPIEMQLGRATADTVEKEQQTVPDVVFWSWIPIFSNQAVSMAIKLGCEPDEFWPCRFQSNPGEKFFFHLPNKSFDIIDIENSTFRQILPLDPPIPMFIQRLVTKPTPEQVPPCFRIDIPWTEQVFSELLVREDLKFEWIQKAFKGAKFRLLSG